MQELSSGSKFIQQQLRAIRSTTCRLAYACDRFQLAAAATAAYLSMAGNFKNHFERTEDVYNSKKMLKLSINRNKSHFLT